MKVFIGPAPLRDYEHAFAPALTAAGYDLIWGPKSHLLNPEQLLAHLPGCAASLAGSEPYTPAVIDAAAHAIITLLKGEWLPDGWVVNPEVKPAFLARSGKG